ncbi:ferritin-like domain-containing protein [Kitasatospora sp. NPDC093806]|uniref:ferritin-like domain-containing protein n=1 Tax=Kitasatospora sp. NPDC093806 TaxID=3155075 RepID=UPI003420C3F3
MQPPSRRTFLALGLLLTAGGALTACTDAHHTDPGAPAADRRPDPDEPVRLRAVAATDTLLAGYDALLAGPGQGRLQPLRAEVAQHRAALAAGLPGGAETPTPTPGAPTSGTPTPGASTSGTATSGTGSGTAGPTATAPAGTVGTPAALAALASLERQTAQSRLADLGAASPQLARLLASVSAAGVLHAVALGDTAPATAPDPAASPSPPGAEGVPAFQSALSAEHAAVYGYGVVGARLPDDQQRAEARSSLAAHQARRDAWQRLLGSAGATPTAAAAGYQLPFPVTDAAAATRLAAHLETRLTGVYADLVAAVPSAQRGLAADALRECALRAQRWGAAATPFPGLPDPAATPAPSTATGSAAATP